MKIGQEIKIKENIFIQTPLGEEVIEVKAGDRAIITKMGVKYITGDARNKINMSNKLDVKGYDVDNICKRVTKALIDNFSDVFEEYMEDYEVTKKDLEEIVYDELSEFI